MITQEQLAAAEKQYPLPGFVVWYLSKFPKKQFFIVGVILFFVGFFSTIFKASHLLIGIVTFAFCALVLTGATLHIIAWHQSRSTFVKRAKFLNVNLQEYLNALS